MTKKPAPPPIENVFMTSEYLCKEGIKLYQEAINIEFKEKKEREDFNKVKTIYIDAILYFQGAMLLGSEEASAYLSEFYSGNHLKINDKELSNLIKTIANISKFLHYSKLTNSVCLKNFGIENYSEYEDLAIIESGYMKAIQTEWHKVPTPKCLVLSNLKSIIKDFNLEIPNEYQLIIDESIFECKKEIEEFTVLDNKQLSQSPCNDDFQVKQTDDSNILGNAALCIIS
ncbi:MAG TPA: hypothetical protein LFW21_03570 [Rickettsia endosymbiont of Pyrocoelia pectoralis]|nr:hypothetical protein [Rickettsia endosymbiont of Pyrocoelia pectoralis]